MSSTYDKRIIDAANNKIHHCGNIPNKNPHHGLYIGYIKTAPEYPFTLSVTQDTSSRDFFGGSVKIKIKTGKKQYNIKGVLSLQEFLQRRICHKPSIDELGEFISLYTIHYQRQKTKDYSTPVETIFQVEPEKVIEKVIEKEKEKEKETVNLEVNIERGQAVDGEDWESLFD